MAGVAAAAPLADYDRYTQWVSQGMAARMGYLIDHRAALRTDPRNLLESAKSIICVGKIYNSPYPLTSNDPAVGWISRYAWGDDYHRLMAQSLRLLVERIAAEAGPFEYRICVDTAPLLERSYARQAGLGWIGKNTCLINQSRGSWFFLAEVLVSLDIEPDSPPPDRCGSCTRCIDACPTQAIVPSPAGGYTLDSRLCISYFTIEHSGPVPESVRPGIGNHVFGCDICQDVCPWNRKAPSSADPALHPRWFAPPLGELAALSETDFQRHFRNSPVPRSRYTGFLRNVAVAMGNSSDCRFLDPLRKLARHADAIVASHAQWSLSRLERSCASAR